MAKKKKNLTAEFWRKDAEQRANAERILELRRLERELADVPRLDLTNAARDEVIVEQLHETNRANDRRSSDRS